jgi:hypothetical protein
MDQVRRQTLSVHDWSTYQESHVSPTWYFTSPLQECTQLAYWLRSVRLESSFQDGKNQHPSKINAPHQQLMKVFFEELLLLAQPQAIMQISEIVDGVVVMEL